MKTKPHKNESPAPNIIGLKRNTPNAKHPSSWICPSLNKQKVLSGWWDFWNPTNKFTTKDENSK
jgi:hypothetical protein